AGVEVSGGSAANTIAGLASLGGRGAYIGKVQKDQLGEVFTHDIRALDVHFATPPLSEGPSTARCLIFVTPDAQRTMCTYLGACAELRRRGCRPGPRPRQRVTYLEGYLWDPPRAKEAFQKAARLAHEAGRKLALSLSDAFCVERHREDFRDLVEHHVDVLFANETEIMALYQTASFDEAAAQVRRQTDVAVLTRSERGSLIFARDAQVEVGVERIGNVVDTTGAGDLYAAGFLYGYTHGMDLGASGRLGALAAAEVISHFGPRPEADLRQLARAHGVALGA
ncbi:MAG: adenosine kinase, partial [Myxococcales bacterium]|nr:adenosine kinase [Myxococcales bacterium]